jgi:hypothetical protein
MLLKSIDFTGNQFTSTNDKGQKNRTYFSALC